MLDVIRKRKNSMIIILALFAIIVVFIFWGVGPTPTQKGGGSVIATVDGVEISANEYAKIYRRQLDYMRETFKEQFSEEFIERMNLKERTINMLVNRILVVKEAQKQGVRVEDKDVQSAVTQIPAFQKDGKFNEDLYFRVLEQNRMKPAEFEDNVRQDILSDKMKAEVLKDVKVTTEEVRDHYTKENRKVSLDVVAVETLQYLKVVEVADEEAKGYFEKNGSRFMEPVRIKAFYARIRLNDVEKTVSPSEEDIKGYYERNIMEFQKQKEVKARHILIKRDAKPGVDPKALAEEVLAKVKKGEDFAALAKKYSEDPGSGPRGGDLGYFGQGIMVKPFDDAVFSLKKGETSGIVETEFGFHIIRVEDIREPRLIPLGEAKKDIERSLRKQKSEEIILEKMEALKSAFRDIEDLKGLEDAAKARGAEPFTSPLISANDKAGELTMYDGLKKEAFLLGAGGVTGPIEANGAFYLVKLIERVDAHLPSFEKTIEKVKVELAMEKARAVAKAKAEEYLKRLKEGEALDALAKKENLSVQKIDYFSKVAGFMPKTGVFVGDKGDLFMLTAASPYYKEPIFYNEAYYIARFKDAREAPEKDFDKASAEITQRLSVQKNEEVYGNWIEDLRKKSKIEINKELL
ncbi:MAG: SurA N-terminal domain-containing protein [Deltaproteobacteria bacterium]|nr:SurA N-terminal domain-containing protein [Deltaproteobacteria bacterium]